MILARQRAGVRVPACLPFFNHVASAPPELLAIHTNMPGVFPDDINNAAFSGAPAPSGLSADEKLAYERLQFVYQKGIGYG